MIWTVLGSLGVVAVVIAAGMLVDRRFGILPRPRELRDGTPRVKPALHAPGEAAETALDAPPSEVRCRACGRRALLDGESRATLGGRELMVRRHRCPRCAVVTTIYSHVQ